MSDKNKDFWENGSSYDKYVREELKDFRKDAWKKQISKHLPLGKHLTVLDVGCGPGFFACILAEKGYNVTGIDRSADMLKYADMNAKVLGLSPKFIQMDANKLEFNDNSFDLIISRNVTWTFDEPAKVYEQFYKKLKPDGRLLIYDANWHIPFYYPDMLEKVRENEKRYYERFGEEFKVYDDDAGIFENLPLSNTWRPEWDIKALEEIGFKDINTDKNVGKKLYTDWELELYSLTPLFEISALK